MQCSPFPPVQQGEKEKEKYKLRQHVYWVLTYRLQITKHLKEKERKKYMHCPYKVLTVWEILRLLLTDIFRNMLEFGYSMVYIILDFQRNLAFHPHSHPSKQKPSNIWNERLWSLYLSFITIEVLCWSLTLDIS